MTIDQISVFVENSPGHLAEVTELLSSKGVDLKALSIADTASYGVLRIIVSDAPAVAAVLTDAGCVVSVTKVLAVAVPNTPGGLSVLLRQLAAAGVSVEYLYAFLSRTSDKACVILRPENCDAAADVLYKAGCEFIASEDL